MKNPPAAPTQSSGRVVDGNRMTGQITVGGTAHEFSIPWDASIKSPAYLDRLPTDHPFKLHQTVILKEFVPEQLQASEVHLTAGRRNGHAA